MKKIIAAAIRLFVIYAIFLFINQLPYIINSIISVFTMNYRAIDRSSISTAQFALSLIPFILTWILYAIFLIIVWIRTDSISELILRKTDPNSSISSNLNLEQFIETGLIILGVYLLIITAPELIQRGLSRITEARFYASQWNGSKERAQSNWAILSLGIRLLLSLILLLETKAIMNFINKMRNRKTRNLE